MKILIAVLFLMVGNAQAEERRSGVVEGLDLAKGLVLIDNISYQLQEGKTLLFSGEHKLGLRSLRLGRNVDYVVEGSFVTEIRLNPPYIFKR